MPQGYRRQKNYLLKQRDKKSFCWDFRMMTRSYAATESLFKTRLLNRAITWLGAGRKHDSPETAWLEPTLAGSE